MSDADRSEGASWWALACRFLDRFAAGGAGHPNLRADDRFDAWMLRVHRVSDLLDAREAHEPWPWPGLADALEALVAGDAEPGDAAHAVAWAIDERFARTFPDDWIAGAAADGFDLADGDLYPVLETPWSIFQPFLSRPASMSDPRPDELPHARRFRAGELRTEKVAHVRIHPVTALLRDVLATLTSVATCPSQPRPSTSSSGLPARGSGPSRCATRPGSSPPSPDLVGEALDGGSRLIVLPELSATAATIAAVRALLDARYDEDEDPALVLVGSRHVEADGHRRNRAVTLITASATQLHHDKLVPFRRGAAIEGLDGPGTLHLYQDGPFRLAGAICKDLLDSDVEAALGAPRRQRPAGAGHVDQDVELPAGRRPSPAHRPDADRRRQRPADRRPRGVDRPLLDDGAADRWLVARVLAARGSRTPCRRSARSGSRIRWTRGRRPRTPSHEPNSLTHH